MPLIKPRTRGKHFVRYITRLDADNHERLHAYAHFLREPPDYVLNQLVDTLDKDKEFLQWRADHPESFVPQPRVAKRGSRQRRSAEVLTGTPIPQVDATSAMTA